jgi:ATP-dependent helicase YprA (DUF1998 family)
MTDDRPGTATAEELAAARADERERCAMACDARRLAELLMRDQRRREGDTEMSNLHGDRAGVLQEQAAAIRALR